MVSTAAALNVESEIYTTVLETLMMKVRIMTWFLTFVMLSSVSILLGLINSFCSLFEFEVFFSLYHGFNQDIVKVCVILSLYRNDLNIIKSLLHKMTEGSRWGVKNRTDFILLLSYLALTPGQVGLVLSLALTLTGMFQWCIRQRTEVENLVMFILTFLALSSLLAIKWHKSNSYVKY